MPNEYQQGYEDAFAQALHDKQKDDKAEKPPPQPQTEAEHDIAVETVRAEIAEHEAERKHGEADVE